MAQKKETTFRQNHVLPFLRSLKATAIFPIQQVAIVGTPDLLLCIRGQFVALELKTDQGILSEIQKYNLDVIGRCGGWALVVAPKNWEVVKKLLKKLDEGIYDQD